MSWLTPNEEYLVEGESYRLPDWVGPVRCPGGDPVRPARFYLVTLGGEVRRTFSEPIEYSIDDEVGLASIHALSGDALLRYHFRQLSWDEPEIKSEVELAGLRAVGAEGVPFDPGRIIASYEGREREDRERRREKDEQEWRRLQEELSWLRDTLRGETGRLHATWEFEPAGCVVKRADGSVLGRGTTWGYGRDVYSKVEAIMRERFGNDFELEVRLVACSPFLGPAITGIMSAVVQ